MLRTAFGLNAISRVPGALQPGGVGVRLLCSARPSPAALSGGGARRRYSAPAAGGATRPPLRWTALEPELEDVLVPRKMSLSPLESWLSLRYSLPSPRATADPRQQPPTTTEGDGDGGGAPEGESRVLPPAGEPVLGGEEEGGGATTPMSCKNVLEIRRRKMNRHKYKKLIKRTTFLRRRVMEGRKKRKQIRFERDLKRIWKRAGLKSAPEGWNAPKIYVRQYQSKKD